MMNAEFTPVSTMTGHRKVHTITQKTRADNDWVSDVFSGLWGPSLNKCRTEKEAKPKTAPTTRKVAIYAFMANPDEMMDGPGSRLANRQRPSLFQPLRQPHPPPGDWADCQDDFTLLFVYVVVRLVLSHQETSALISPPAQPSCDLQNQHTNQANPDYSLHQDSQSC
jgi:hypothetical protein